MKTTLNPKQEKLLNNDEKQILNLFFNIKPTNKKTPDFIENYRKNISLYQRLVKIYNHLGESYTRKYLTGYIEYSGSNNSFHDYLITSN